MRHQTPGPPSKPVPGRGRRTARRAVRGRDDLAKHGLREGWPSDLGSGLENCHGRKFDNGQTGRNIDVKTSVRSCAAGRAHPQQCWVRVNHYAARSRCELSGGCAFGLSRER
jgi:hypothetical protein